MIDLTDDELNEIESGARRGWPLSFDAQLSMVAEIRRHRATKVWMEELALLLEDNYHPDIRKVGRELRNRMRGEK